MDNWLSEIRLFPFSVLPKGWALCDGSLLPVKQNAALFSLLGTTYGGDGVNTFALPDLRGRVPVDAGTLNGTYQKFGTIGGVDTVTLTQAQIPQHSHTATCMNTVANKPLPTNNFPATVIPNASNPAPNVFSALTNPPQPTVSLNPGSVLAAGGGQAHENRQPTMALRWCICVLGVYPPRN
jgi:microcystin-dependent protein